ncbi:MAG TPA: tyrosine-type recombinase/integrase, partial [bacterium]|nr:tyrosine-type recombinase/integrase [bacterium]
DGAAQEAKTIPTFGSYAISLLTRRVARGKVQSESALEGWKTKLSHLLPYFKDRRLDEIRRADVEAWWDGVAQQVKRREYAARTANGWLAKLQQITKSAADEYDLRDPARGMEPLYEPPAYSPEEPNSLTPEEVPVFLAAWREKYPQHFVFIMLGFATGQRPSHLRPLRRKGPHADVLWEKRTILIRRSHSRKQKVMEKTKVGPAQAITVGPTMIELLREHAATLPETSDLLFPGKKGGFMCVRALTNLWGRVAKAAGIEKKITGRAMRRTFQDVARQVGVDEFIVRSISGHATKEMHWHYSTPLASEQQAAIDQMIAKMLGGGANGGAKEAESAPN